VTSKALRVPADLSRRIEETAADMGMPPAWVLRARIETALTCEDEHTIVHAVLDVARSAVRMPRYGRAASSSRGSSRGFSGPDARKPKRANGIEPSTFSLGSILPTDPGPENVGNVDDLAEGEQGRVTENDRS